MFQNRNIFGQAFNYIMNVQWMKGGHLWMNSIHDDTNNDVDNDARNDVGSDVDHDVGDVIHNIDLKKNKIIIQHLSVKS